MFYICGIVVIFCVQTWKGAEVKKTKKLTHDEIKKKLIESLIMKDTIETDELNKKAEEVKDSEKAAEVIQECKNIIRTKKNDIIRIAHIIKARFLKSLRTRRSLSYSSTS